MNLPVIRPTSLLMQFVTMHGQCTVQSHNPILNWAYETGAGTHGTFKFIEKNYFSINPSRNYRKTLRMLRATARLGRLRGALSRSKLLRSRPLINFRRPRRHFERAFLPDLAVLAPKLVRPSLPGTPPASIFESRTTVLFDVCPFDEHSARKTSNIKKTL